MASPVVATEAPNLSAGSGSEARIWTAASVQEPEVCIQTETDPSPELLEKSQVVSASEGAPITIKLPAISRSSPKAGVGPQLSDGLSASAAGVHDPPTNSNRYTAGSVTMPELSTQ